MPPVLYEKIALKRGILGGGERWNCELDYKKQMMSVFQDTQHYSKKKLEQRKLLFCFPDHPQKEAEKEMLIT